MSKKTKILSSVSVVAMMGMAMPSLAAQEASNAGIAFEEIVVTASKRQAQSVQNIAANISAVGAQTMEKIGALGFTDLAKFVPGLTSADNGPGNQRIIIRGLSSATGAAQVGAYFDEIPASGNGGINVNQTDLQLYDLERVEVLRGPQGTLYGNGSQGGTIRYITRKADPSGFAGSFDTDVGFRSRDGGQSYTFNGMVNVPVVEDKFALRAVAFYRDRDGYADVPALGIDGANTEENWGGRLMATALLGEDTTLTASAWYQNMEAGDLGQVLPAGDTRPGEVLEPAEDELKMFNATLEHSEAWGTFTATASYYKRDTFHVFDVSQFVPGAGSINQTRDTDLFSAEVRFASDFDGPLQFILGGFYQDRDYYTTSIGFFVDPTTGLVPDGAARFFDTRTDEGFTNKALFGEVTYDVTDKLELLAGFRVFEIKNDSQSNQLATPFGVPSGLGPLLNAKNDDVIFKMQASYQITDDALAYLVFSEGFREGGANNPNLVTQGGVPAPLSYGPDFVKNYELGWKSQFADRQITFNGAVYYMKWTGIQVGVLDINRAFEYTDNVGKADLYGIELETTYRPKAMPGFSATVNMSYSEQQLTENSQAFNDGDVTGGADGDNLPYTFPFSASLILEQRFQVADYDAFATFNMTYQDTALTEFSTRNTAARTFGDYVIAGARVGLEGDGWTASLYATNLFDKRTAVNWTVEANPGIPDRILTTQPRTVGISVGMDF